MLDIRTFVDVGLTHLGAAAQIWAEATAARDGDPDVAPLELSRPVIQHVLGEPGGFLLIAERDGVVVGFAAVAPTGAGVAELHYLGVGPRFAGAGVGKTLLGALPGELTLSGFTEAALKVYVDNFRAVRLYETAGWRPRGAPSVHPRSGRLEQEYRLKLQHRCRTGPHTCTSACASSASLSRRRKAM